MGSLAESEHLKARGFFVEVVHPEAGRLQYPGAPYKLSETPWEVRSPAPALGQHNEAVFRDRLGLSDDELASLREAGAV
jgi:crotonobetainyl-CoA:carnitine CoA-transferase CaiB-like acyl-CoA transferase